MVWDMNISTLRCVLRTTGHSHFLAHWKWADCSYLYLLETIHTAPTEQKWNLSAATGAAITDCTLETTLTFKAILASDIYLFCLTWFKVFYHMQIPTARQTKSNMQYNASDGQSSSNTWKSIRNHLELKFAKQCWWAGGRFHGLH